MAGFNKNRMVRLTSEARGANFRCVLLRFLASTLRSDGGFWEHSPPNAALLAAVKEASHASQGRHSIHCSTANFPFYFISVTGFPCSHLIFTNPAGFLSVVTHYFS